MFGVLLESRARRQPRTGGAALAIAAHLAVAGAIGAASAGHNRFAAKDDTRQVYVRFARQQQSTLDVPVAHPDRRATLDVANAANVASIHIAPLDLHNASAIGPVVDFTAKATAPLCAECDGVGLRPTTFFATNPPKAPVPAEVWRATDVLMRMLTSVTPRYPEPLRAAGIEGSVLVRFTVDTAGRVDMATVKILSSTHDLFAAAVRDALARFRFEAAEVDGRRVPALAEMPFEFRLK